MNNDATEDRIKRTEKLLNKVIRARTRMLKAERELEDFEATYLPTIEELDLNIRIFNALKHDGFYTIYSIVNSLKRGGIAELLTVRSFGEKSLVELLTKMQKHGDLNNVQIEVHGYHYIRFAEKYPDILPLFNQSPYPTFPKEIDMEKFRTMIDQLSSKIKNV